MSPIQGMFLAAMGAAGLACSLFSKRQSYKLAGVCLFILGAYGFANVIGGTLPIKVN